MITQAGSQAQYSSSTEEDIHSVRPNLLVNQCLFMQMQQAMAAAIDTAARNPPPPASQQQPPTTFGQLFDLGQKPGVTTTSQPGFSSGLHGVGSGPLGNLSAASFGSADLGSMVGRMGLAPDSKSEAGLDIRRMGSAPPVGHPAWPSPENLPGQLSGGAMYDRDLHTSLARPSQSAPLGAPSANNGKQAINPWATDLGRAAASSAKLSTPTGQLPAWGASNTTPGETALHATAGGAMGGMTWETGTGSSDGATWGDFSGARYGGLTQQRSGALPGNKFSSTGSEGEVPASVRSHWDNMLFPASSAEQNRPASAASQPASVRMMMDLAKLQGTEQGEGLPYLHTSEAPPLNPGASGNAGPTFASCWRDARMATLDLELFLQAVL